MKVFLSWSGVKSQKIAIILRDWIPSVIQSVEPYVSSEDIDKGARWNGEIAKELDESAFGILCVTKDNTEEPWLLFEAGALSKRIDISRVCPFLFDLKRSDLKGPLSQFQSSLFEKEEVRKLMNSINSACGDTGIAEDRLNAAFNMWWPNLEESYTKLIKEFKDKDNIIQASDKAKQEDILEELLNVVRSNQRILSSPEILLPPVYFHNIMMQERRAVPSMSNNRFFRDIMMTVDVLEKVYSEGTSLLENYLNQGKVVDNSLFEFYQAFGRRLQEMHFQIDSLFREGRLI